MSFNPHRLTFARKRRGMTMKQLSGRVGVEPRAISAWENGEYGPREEHLALLMKELKFPEGFFSGDELDEPDPVAVSFRSMSKMTAQQRDRAIGAGAIGILLNKWLETRFELPDTNLPDLSQEASPEDAAHYVRHAWGLGELPIKNMVHLLESKGVRVFSLSVDALEVDACSVWRQKTPFVFLNTQKSAERSRFDAAHELGHLLLHRHGSPQGQEAEQQANSFASALLMPRDTILAQAPRVTTMAWLLQAKKYWTVSIAALAYRLHTVKAISDWNYRSLYIDIGKRGYRKVEPNESPRESSQLLRKVFETLRSEGITKRGIADALLVAPQEIHDLVFGLALSGVEAKGRPEKGREERPTLRIVD